MTALHYVPGSSPVATTDEGAVVLGAGASTELAVAAWRHLRAGAGIVGVIDALAAGRPLSALPAFAIVVPEGDGWRVAVRGAFSVTRADGVAVDTVAGAPWVERSIASAAPVTITSSAPYDEREALPLTDGVALADAVVVARDLAAAAPSAAAAASSAPVEPVQPHTVAEVHDAPAAEPARTPPPHRPAADSR